VLTQGRVGLTINVGPESVCFALSAVDGGAGVDLLGEVSVLAGAEGVGVIGAGVGLPGVAGLVWELVPLTLIL
jgi:hypothetical protein